MRIKAHELFDLLHETVDTLTYEEALEAYYTLSGKEIVDIDGTWLEVRD